MSNTECVSAVTTAYVLPRHLLEQHSILWSAVSNLQSAYDVSRQANHTEDRLSCQLCLLASHYMHHCMTYIMCTTTSILPVLAECIAIELDFLV